MDKVVSIAAALAGAAAGWFYGVWAARMVASRPTWWFWAAAVGAFVIGVGAAFGGLLADVQAVVWGGFAFAALGASALKWRSGHVPGVPVARPEDSD